ncbi:hypothetical protein EVAR_17146_1 [Eumeta japonica]|uniref:Uncharacterized protein n=1 Tax=Eumeta variegata TaxID=151549 RepID=A0A4C1UNM0_EUMVA|nr:hypothetical protein EVAR_17146_1 [Eumeta japonica]
MAGIQLPYVSCAIFYHARWGLGMTPSAMFSVHYDGGLVKKIGLLKTGNASIGSFSNCRSAYWFCTRREQVLTLLLHESTDEFMTYAKLALYLCLGGHAQPTILKVITFQYQPYNL